ncbi:MAG: magnesium transporter [Candidatus Hadarchaeales archaeon]
MARKNEFREVFVQGFSVLVICVLIELLAGGFMKTMEQSMVAVSGLAIMTLPLLDLRGNINGAFASRLGTALHLGIVPPKLKLTKEIKINLVSSIVLTLMASVTIGALSWATGVILGTEVDILKIFFISIFAGMLSGVLLAFLTICVAIFSHVRGLDPDNITAPLMATIGDFVTVFCIYFAVILVV